MKEAFLSLKDALNNRIVYNETKRLSNRIILVRYKRKRILKEEIE